MSRATSAGGNSDYNVYFAGKQIWALKPQQRTAPPAHPPDRSSRRGPGGSMIADMERVHMAEADVARDFAAAPEKVRQGLEVVVEHDRQPVAVLRPATPPRRTISECIALAERREKERGHAVTLDPDFAADVEGITRSRKPWNPPAWD